MFCYRHSRLVSNVAFRSFQCHVDDDSERGSKTVFLGCKLFLQWSSQIHAFRSVGTNQTLDELEVVQLSWRTIQRWSKNAWKSSRNMASHSKTGMQSGRYMLIRTFQAQSLNTYGSNCSKREESCHMHIWTWRIDAMMSWSRLWKCFVSLSYAFHFGSTLQHLVILFDLSSSFREGQLPLCNDPRYARDSGDGCWIRQSTTSVEETAREGRLCQKGLPHCLPKWEVVIHSADEFAERCVDNDRTSR